MRRTAPPAEDSSARAGSDAVVVGLGYLASFAYPLVSLPFLSRVIGADDLGRLMFALAVLQLVIYASDFGFGSGALRRVATASGRIERSRVVLATLAAKLGLWAVCAVVLMAIVLAVPGLRALAPMYAIGLGLIGVGALYPTWLLQGVGRLREFALFTALSRLVALGLLLATVRGPEDLGLAMLWQQFPLALCAVACWTMMALRWHEVVPVRITRADVRAALQDSAPLFVSNVAVLMMGAANSVVLGIVSTSPQVAYFGAGERFSNAVRGVMRGVVDAMLPRMTRHGEDARRIQRTIMLALVGAYTLAGLGLVVCAPWFIPWYLGEAMAPAAPVMQLMGVALPAVGVTSALTLRLTAAHRFRAIARLAGIGAGVHLVLLIPASALWGAIGAGLALILSELVMAGLYLHDVRAHRAEPPAPGDTAIPDAPAIPAHPVRTPPPARSPEEQST